MVSRVTEVIIDCHDIEVVADFWCAVLGYSRAEGGEGWRSIRAPGPGPTSESLASGAPAPALTMVTVPEDKVVKNRLHLDITPADRSQASEVERLDGLGATRVDIGQGTPRWVVMADPEGNEFCVMPVIGA